MATSKNLALCLRVLLFASLRETMGWGEKLIELPAHCTPLSPLQLWQQLGIQPITPPSNIRVAINQEFASWDAALQAGDELAFLPPISGG
jgi:sulfur-carrier protein